MHRRVARPSDRVSPTFPVLQTFTPLAGHWATPWVSTGSSFSSWTGGSASVLASENALRSGSTTQRPHSVPARPQSLDLHGRQGLSRARGYGLPLLAAFALPGEPGGALLYTGSLAARSLPSLFVITFHPSFSPALVRLQSSVDAQQAREALTYDPHDPDDYALTGPVVHLRYDTWRLETDRDGCRSGRDALKPTSCTR